MSAKKSGCFDRKISRRAFIAQSAAAITLSRGARAALAAPSAPMQAATTLAQPVPFGFITPAGDIAHRTAQNLARLESPIYRSPQLFNQPNVHSWPGDFEGRDLLALTLLSQTSPQSPDYLAAMFAEYPAHLNSQGYFGLPLDPHAINEQQLSGHGWFLRGLCEYYEFTPDPAARAQSLAQIQAIVRNLALPLRGSYATYPIDPALRTRTSSTPGGIVGHLDAEHADWVLSSDIGCAFIFLDGLTHAWVVLRSVEDPSAPALKSLIDEAIARFLQVDLVAAQLQTHATLTAMRALMRVYGETADPILLQAVRDRYRLYRTVAMTEHYANYNWFGRPETWTEPCAIIDSFILATQLWQHTADPSYLEDAHLIWFNGVGRGQRSNGGFGTDLCAGYKTPFLKVRSYEAPSCCTMRGGEGHARAAQYLYFTAPHAASPILTVPFYCDSEASIGLGGSNVTASATHKRLGTLHVTNAVTSSSPNATLVTNSVAGKAHGAITFRQTTSYPNPGPTRIEVLSTTASSPITLRLFAPRWTSGHRLTLNGRPLRTTFDRGFLTARLTPKAGDVLVLDFTLRVGPREPINPKSIAGYYAFEAGPLILGYQAPAAPAVSTTSGATGGATTPRAANPANAPNPEEIYIPRNARLVLNDSGGYRVDGTDILLSRINDLNDSAATPRDPCTRQILFRTA